MFWILGGGGTGGGLVLGGLKHGGTLVFVILFYLHVRSIDYGFKFLNRYRLYNAFKA